LENQKITRLLIVVGGQLAAYYSFSPEDCQNENKTHKKDALEIDWKQLIEEKL